MSRILEIYKAVLTYSGMVADGDGFISVVLNERKDPVTVNGLRLVLPTEHQLRNANPGEKMIFHPLSENILRGESEVITKLREVISIKLNYTIGVVMQSLLDLAASEALHARLTPEQSEMIFQVKEVDSTSVTNFINAMIAGVKQHPERVFTRVFLKKGGSVKGKRHARVGVITFPFLTELEKEGKDAKKIYGVSIRAKDRAPYKALFDYLLPNAEVPEQYNYGSDSNTAPYLDALLKSTMNIASRLNDVIEEFKEYIDHADQLMFDSAWVDSLADMENLTSEIRRIPAQFGNEGRTHEEQPMAPPQVPQPAYPVPQPQLPPQYAPPPNYPPPGNYPPNYPPPQQAGIIRNKDGSIDFAAMKATNPALAMQPNPLANQLHNQYLQQQQQYAQHGYPPPGNYPPNYPPPLPYPQQAMMPPQYPQPMPPGYPPAYPQPAMHPYFAAQQTHR